MTIFFSFSEITIQVHPGSDRCYIFKNGIPIWSGTHEELISLLEEAIKRKPRS